MPLALAATFLGLVLWLATTGAPAGAARWATPWAIELPAWVGAGLLALGLGGLAWRRPREGGGRALLLLLALYGTGFVAQWRWHDGGATALRQLAAFTPTLLLLLLVAAWMRQAGAGWGLWGPGSVHRAARELALPTIAGLVLLLGLGHALGGQPAQARAVEFASYPLWALLQLVLFLPPLSFLLGRTGHPRAVVPLAVGLFALAHWPNPLLLVATAAGMLLWAPVWRRHGQLWVTALSMGLLAVALAQGWPPALTGSMKAGPGHLAWRAGEAEVRRFEARIDAIAGEDAWDAAGGELEPWLARSWRELGGDELPPARLDSLARALRAAHRCQLARVVLNSDEARARTAGARFLTPDRVAFLRDDLDPATPGFGALPELCPDDVDLVLAEGLDEFLQRLYVEVLGREPPLHEMSAWPRPLPEPARRRLVHCWLQQREGGLLPGWYRQVCPPLDVPGGTPAARER